MTGMFLALGTNMTKAGVREDLGKANQLSDEQWVEKSKLFISAFDELYTGLVNKWREVGGDLSYYETPFILHAWKNNKFVETSWSHINKEGHNISTCGMHWLRGACCYPCTQCCDDTGVNEKDCFDTCVEGTPFFCCTGPFFACCCIETTTTNSDYFTLHIYKPICKQWLFPLLGIEKGNCKKLYAYWMHNFCEPVANLLQKVLKQDFTQFTAEQLDAALNLYRVYYNADNHFFTNSSNLCLLPFIDVLPKSFNNKFADLIINSLNITHKDTLQYLSIILALDTDMTNETVLNISIHNLEWYKLEILSIFKVLAAQSAIQTIQIHSDVAKAYKIFEQQAKQKQEEANSNQQGIAAGNGFVYAVRNIYY